MDSELDTILLFILVIVLITTIYINCREVYSKNKGIHHEEPFGNGLARFNVDRIFYINLDKRPDRNQQIKNELKKMNIDLDRDVERYPAVHNSKNGHIGCAKSHRNIIDIALARNYDRIMIFEDDFIFTDYDAIDKVNKFLDNFKNNWDVVQLSIGYKNLTPLDQSQYNFDVGNIARVVYGTTSSGYMINSTIFQQLRDNLDEAIRLMEKEAEIYNDRRYETKYALDQHWGSLQKVSKWYVFQPVLGEQGGVAGKSSIMDVDGFIDI